MAVVGVYFLSGADSASHLHGISSVIGIIWEMLAGLSYAVYMVVFPRMRISKMPSIKTTFYVFFFALLMLVAYVSFTEACPARHSVGQDAGMPAAVGTAAHHDEQHLCNHGIKEDKRYHGVGAWRV